MFYYVLWMNQMDSFCSQISKPNIFDLDLSALQALACGHLWVSPLPSCSHPRLSGIRSYSGFHKQAVLLPPPGLLCALLLSQTHSCSPHLYYRVCSGCYNSTPQTRWFISNRNILLTVLEAGCLKIGVPAEWGSGEGSLAGLPSSCILNSEGKLRAHK